MESKKPIIISDGANNIEVYDDKIVFDIDDKKEKCSSSNAIVEIFEYISSAQQAKILKNKLGVQEENDN